MAIQLWFNKQNKTKIKQANKWMPMTSVATQEDEHSTGKIINLFLRQAWDKVHQSGALGQWECIFQIKLWKEERKLGSTLVNYFCWGGHTGCSMLRAPDLIAMEQIPEVHTFPESFLLVSKLAVHHGRVRQSLASLSMLWRLFPSPPSSLWQAFSCPLPAECGYFNQLCHMLGFIQNKSFEMDLSLGNIPWDSLHSFSWLPKWIFL